LVTGDNSALPEEKLEEETYSLIFTSLKHPIRRRILRMLANQHLTFSEILGPLSIDSGHLSYHLENLGDLITRSENGKYRLSSIGIAAVKLMSGVEEHPTVPSRKESKIMLGFVNVYLLVLIGALIVASLYFVNFTVASTAYGTEGPRTVFLIHQGQTFEYNYTIVYLYNQGIEVHTVENNLLYHERTPPVSTLTMWEVGRFWFDLESNETYDIFINLHRPDGIVIPSRLTQLAAGLPVLDLGDTDITQAGTYRLEIQNIGSQDLRASFRVHEEWQLFKKPYFYYGITGILVATFYPALILFKLLKALKAPPKSQVASLFQ